MLRRSIIVVTLVLTLGSAAYITKESGDAVSALEVR